ncbi:DUF2232 domain-containing protein, partial [Candidatus Latescibacterota bacterium]
MSLIFIELPFIVCYAVFARIFGWKVASLFALSGTVVSFALIFPGNPVTYLVFLKISVMGIIIGKQDLFGGTFLKRISAVTFPGFILGLIFGLPIVISGVAPEILELIREDTLQIYMAFMSEDNALNTLENAMFFFNQIFKIGLAFYFLFAIILSWLSFHLSNLVMKRIKEPVESIPPFYTFKLPFNAVWVLLFG